MSDTTQQDAGAATAPPEATSVAEQMAATLRETTEHIEAPSFLSQTFEKMDKPEATEETPTEPVPTPKPTRQKQPKNEFDPSKVKADDIPDEPHGNTTDEGKIRWGEMKKTVAFKEQELERVRTEYEAKLKDLQERASALPELEEKAKRFEEAERELSIHRIESSQEYRDVVLAPLDAIGGRADAIAEKYELDKDAMASAIAERDPANRASKLSEIVNGMDDVEKFEVLEMARDAQKVLATADRMREKAAAAKAELEKITAEKQTNAQKQFQQALEAETRATVEGLKQRIPFIPLKEGETNELFWAGAEKAVREMAFDPTDAQQLAFAKAAAYLLPRAQRQLVQVQQELAKAQDRVKKFTSATPSLVPSGSDPRHGADTGPGWYPGKVV